MRLQRLFAPRHSGLCSAVNRTALVVRLFGWLLTVVLTLSGVATFAQDVLPVPALSAHVMDQTGTLDANQTTALEAALADLETRKGAQVVVLMVASTQPEDIASYANRVANTWKIGRRDIGDGVLVIVAKNDRRLRIEVAKTLEGAIPDLAASRIIDETITPGFKRGDFAGGLRAGVDQIAALVAGEPLPAPAPASAGHSDPSDWTPVVVFLMILVPLFGSFMRSVLGRKPTVMAIGGGAGVLTYVIGATFWMAVLAAMATMLYALVTCVQLTRGGGRGRGGGGSSGGSGGSSGSGGYSSGGGGDFGGGGASGSW